MTKEEREKAIDIFIKRAKCRATSIDNIIEGIGIKCGETACEECPLYYDNDELHEAERIALEALKQEPCEDAISRKAVLDATVKKNSAWNTITNASGENLEEIINSLPNVTPTNKWVKPDYDKYPETYPEAFQEVWETDEYGDVIHRAYGGERNIIAWMPFVTPEPYKESN